MKLPLSWVNLYAPISPILKTKGSKELAHMYSTHSAEIEAIEEHRIDGIVVGRVLSTARHPESTKLWIVEVELGEHGKETILTGAQNVDGAEYVPVAMVGTKFSPDFEITPRKMAGMVSRWMICSTDEMGLTKTEADGIMVLEDYFDKDVLAAHLGKSFFDLEIEFTGLSGEAAKFPIGDTVFEIENKNITNRPDLFGIVGNAREFATLFDLPLKSFGMPEFPKSGLTVNIQTPNVLTYGLLSVKNVEVKPSPFGFALVLERSDHVSRLNVVDVTNVMMSELGQPMHVFDADKITGNVTVRQAKNGESFEALDGKTYELSEADMVIADDARVLALAGIIGGTYSAVTESTKNVYFEAAVFDATSVRLTAQRLACRTDSSTRFEKSLDPRMCEKALARTLSHLKFLGLNDQADAGFLYVDEKRVANISMDISMEFITKRIGREIPDAEIMRILTSLGLEPKINNGTLKVHVPSWRATKDISIREDIVEEIARITGYDEIEEAPIAGKFSIASRSVWSDFRNATLDFFVGEKFNEVYNYSFSNEEKDSKILIEDTDNAVRIKNAVSAEYTIMRRYMAPLLLSAVFENLKQQPSFRLFELSAVHFKNGENNFSETKRLSGVIVGEDVNSARNTLDAYLRSVCSTEDGIDVTQGANEPFYHPNVCGTYALNGTPIGTFGLVHPRVADNFELGGNQVVFFDLDASTLMKAHSERKIVYREPSRYPAITRELNFVMDEKMSSGEVSKEISSVDAIVRNVTVQDVFVDATKVGEGKKSVTFSFQLQLDDRTITDEEALSTQNRIIESMGKKGFALRGN